MDLHLVVTTLCDRNCEFCCNKQYDIKNLQYVSDNELWSCENLFLTGGEPFEYANPSKLAVMYKKKYTNIKKVVVYTNAVELMEYLKNKENTFDGIDGVNVSIKNYHDLWAFIRFIYSDERILALNSNRVYDFTGSLPMLRANMSVVSHFELINREWQKEFVPADNCIFRRGN